MRRGGRGRGPRRVGSVYLLLWVLGPVAALGLARRFDLGVASTLVSVLVGLAPGYLAWHSFRADRAEADPVDLDRVVGELAVAVRNQWDSEAAVRRVNDPYPLPVSWRVADDSLTEAWALLTDLARSWPGGPPGDPALWSPDATGLAGRDAEIGQVFSERVPTRRLVILGEPGAGKSVLLIRLLQDLVARRTDGAPVPVLFSLASWDPHRPLKAWMADQLRRTHPGLASAAPSSVTVTDTASDEPTDLAAYLLSAGLVLPLLDGFDELPPALHATALDMLNRALPAKQPLVLTSRTDPYRTALTRLGTVVRLNGAAAVQLLPLDAQAAADYLRRDAGGPHTPAAHRWNSVITHLGTNSPVGQALATPLGLFLARTIYNPRPGTPAGSPQV
ncbi:NACHT domain-containing protein, partial [Streptomyces spongiae]|nr:NACHT domain-containing protein [Streptomyces spongiae]